MENIFKLNDYQNGVAYQLLGHEKQTLQLVLLPGQQIVTKQEAILYSSNSVIQSKY